MVDDLQDEKKMERFIQLKSPTTKKKKKKTGFPIVTDFLYRNFLYKSVVFTFLYEVGLTPISHTGHKCLPYGLEPVSYPF